MADPNRSRLNRVDLLDTVDQPLTDPISELAQCDGANRVADQLQLWESAPIGALTSTISFDPDVHSLPDFVGGHRLQLGGVHQGDGRCGNQEQGRRAMQDESAACGRLITFPDSSVPVRR